MQTGRTVAPIRSEGTWAFRPMEQFSNAIDFSRGSFPFRIYQLRNRSERPNPLNPKQQVFATAYSATCDNAGQKVICTFGRTRKNAQALKLWYRYQQFRTTPQLGHFSRCLGNMEPLCNEEIEFLIGGRTGVLLRISRS